MIHYSIDASLTVSYSHDCKSRGCRRQDGAFAQEISRRRHNVYSAFKEPEMRKLLEELEHAKTSMLFAYMSYCQ
jgi:NAD(P)H-flavin reductase